MPMHLFASDSASPATWREERKFEGILIRGQVCSEIIGPRRRGRHHRKVLIPRSIQRLLAAFQESKARHHPTKASAHISHPNAKPRTVYPVQYIFPSPAPLNYTITSRGRAFTIRSINFDVHLRIYTGIQAHDVGRFRSRDRLHL